MVVAVNENKVRPPLGRADRGNESHRNEQEDDRAADNFPAVRNSWRRSLLEIECHGNILPGGECEHAAVWGVRIPGFRARASDGYF